MDMGDPMPPGELTPGERGSSRKEPFFLFPWRSRASRLSLFLRRRWSSSWIL